MTQVSRTKGTKKGPWKVVLLSAFSILGGGAVYWVGKQQTETAKSMRSVSKPATTVVEVSSRQISSASAGVQSEATKEQSAKENWRDAPIGDGEDTPDSYHSYDHRPTGSDPRDTLLQQYTIHPCPNNGIGTMVSGQDPRYYELDPPDNEAHKERNPKFLCDVTKIPDSPHQPCVVYSFGSWDEISFEVCTVE